MKAKRKREADIIRELEAQGIELFADNDGGLWYTDPVTRTTKYI